MTSPPLQSERVILRRWRAADRAPFAALNADPEVMRHFPAPLTREQSDGLVDAIEAHMDREGFCFWALEIPGVLPFAGFVGLKRPGYETHFTPCVEVGWRLAREAWGVGYASEAARLAMAHGFDTIGLEEIVSFTSESNLRSIAVMERIGMTRDRNGDFEHPLVPEGHALRPHVLYRMRADERPG